MSACYEVCKFNVEFVLCLSLWIFVSYFVEVCLLEKKEEVHVPKGTQGVPKKEIYKVEKLRSLFCSLLLSFAGKSSFTPVLVVECDH